MKCCIFLVLLFATTLSSPVHSDGDDEVADVIFLLDGSSSVGEENFKTVKLWMGKVMQNLNVEEHVHVGVIQYSYYYSGRSWSNQKYIRVEIPLEGHRSIDSFIDLVNNISLIGYSTFTGRGLQRTRMEFNEHGRNGTDEKKICKMAVVVTDGAATDYQHVADRAQELRDAGVTVISVGVGDINEKELRVIATGDEDSDTGVVILNDFDSIYNIIDYINDNIRTCGKHLEPPVFDEPIAPSTTTTTTSTTTTTPRTTTTTTTLAPLLDLDIIFLIDGSCSITADSFSRTKLWITSVADKLEINQGTVDIGVIHYGFWFSVIKIHNQPQMNTVVQLGQHSYETFYGSLMGLNQFGQGSSTGHAMENALYEFYNSRRQNVCKVVVVLTDGKSTDRDMITASESMKECNIVTFAIAVEEHSDKFELKMIAGEEERVLYRHGREMDESFAIEFVGILRNICK